VIDLENNLIPLVVCRKDIVSSKIDSLAVSTLDTRYTLARVVWNMHFERSAGESIYSQNAAS